MLLVFCFTFSCRREKTEFDYDYWSSNQDSFPNVRNDQFLVPEPGRILTFSLTNQMDSTEPVKILNWKWLDDTMISGKKIHVLECNMDNHDIILPNKLYLILQNSGAYHFLKNYTYPMYDISLTSNQKDSTYNYWTVGSMKYLYSFKSPMQFGNYNGYERRQIFSRIDSFASFGEIGKQVEITFTQTFGITDIVLSRILYSTEADTLSKYRFKRLQ